MVLAGGFDSSGVDASQDSQPWLDLIASRTTSLPRKRGGMGSKDPIWRHAQVRGFICVVRGGR